MATARKYRVMPVDEDTGERGYLLAIDPGENEWPEDWIETREAWPDWRCEICSTKNDGGWINCGYCGQFREDLDALP